MAVRKAKVEQADAEIKPEETTQENTGKTVEVNGITVNVKCDPANDYELVKMMLVRMDKEATSEQRSIATLRYNSIILGDEEQRVMDELRAKNGGKLTAMTMNSFIAQVVKKVTELKN